MLTDVFGLAEHQEKTTYGLGFKVTLRRTKDGATLHKAMALADASTEIDPFH